MWEFRILLMFMCPQPTTLPFSFLILNIQWECQNTFKSQGIHFTTIYMNILCNLEEYIWLIFTNTVVWRIEANACLDFR